jgi:hypothetical protein
MVDTSTVSTHTSQKGSAMIKTYDYTVHLVEHNGRTRHDVVVIHWSQVTLCVINGLPYRCYKVATVTDHDYEYTTKDEPWRRNDG